MVGLFVSAALAGTCRIYLVLNARGKSELPCQQPAVYRRAARKGLTVLETNRLQFTVVQLERPDCSGGSRLQFNAVQLRVVWRESRGRDTLSLHP